LLVEGLDLGLLFSETVGEPSELALVVVYMVLAQLFDLFVGFLQELVFGFDILS